VGLALVGLWAGAALAAPVTPDQAKSLVSGWLKIDASPLGTRAATAVGTPEKRFGGNGSFYYYVVGTGTGFAIVPGDDRIEPIIAFSPSGYFDGSVSNPLRVLVERDLKGRFAALGFSGSKTGAALQAKWEALTAAMPVKAGIASVSDVRVDPLVQTKWSQSTAYSGGPNCYNYYTPNHYVCGCVATAMAQLMRFYQLPAAGIGVHSFPITVDGVTQTATTRGGDGAGGAYDWASMVLDPAGSSATLTEAQCAAIGALTYDAGVAAHMNYSSGESGTGTNDAREALVNTFGYTNAIYGYSGTMGVNIPNATLLKMVNPNLDAGRPVLLGLTDTSTGGGHEIVCDGYGYQTGTLYHHMNLGWAGAEDLWYNMPNLDNAGFDVIDDICYNIYPSGTGETLSGRVLDALGNPIAGAVVTGTGGGRTLTDTTDARGIYALAGFPSAATVALSVTATGHAFSDQSVTVGQSTNAGLECGNLWGVDFQEGVTPSPTPTGTGPTSTPAPTHGGGGGGGGCSGLGFAPFLLILLPAGFLALRGRR
jgi:hypothetical protein